MEPSHGCAHYNPNTQGQLGLQSKVQDNQGYTEKLCLTIQTNKQKKTLFAWNTEKMWVFGISHKKRSPSLYLFAWTHYLSLYSLVYKMGVMFMLSQDSVGLNVKGKACDMINSSQAWWSIPLISELKDVISVSSGETPRGWAGEKSA